MILKLQCLVIITLFSVSTLRAQKSDNSSFIIMSSHGYMKSDLSMSGSGHINTFLYSPSKLWAYGVDMSMSQGRNNYISKAILNLSLSPSIYLFPLNTNKHQIYLGVSAGVGYTDISSRNKEGDNLANELPKFWLNENKTVVSFGANTGYNYKLKRNWMIGARVYYDYNLYSSIMGLISVGARF